MPKKKTDMLPNVTEKFQRKRDGTLVERAYTPAPEPAPEPAPVEKLRVRILRRITSKNYGVFDIGQVACLPVAQAKEWVQLGLAEFDKIFDSAPETK
jgi:hypothetical protein